MVQINSIYVNDGQTVITLFIGDGGRMEYAVDDIRNRITREVKLDEALPVNLQQEVERKAEKVWGFDKNLYILKTFSPWSQTLVQFFMHCWHEVRLREKTLFNK